MKIFFLNLILVLLIFTGCQDKLKAKTAYYNCRIITPDKIIERGLIVIDNGIISYAGEYIKPNDKQIKYIDASGLTALPLFINAHVHNAFIYPTLEKFLKGGVGAVRDLCPYNSSEIGKQKNNYKNSNVARIFASTPIITIAGGYGPYYVSTPEDAREKVKKFIDEGVDVIKTSVEDYCQGRGWQLIPIEILKAIVDEAHKNGKKVSAHVTLSKNLKIALECGVDEIAHMIIDKIKEEDIKLAKKNNVIFIPTLELWNGVDKKHGTSFLKIALSNLERLDKAGVRIALGTDFNGYSINFDEGFPYTEIELMKQAGMSNLSIIKAATINAAFTCGSNEIGALEKGKIADILFVKGKPDEDLSAFKNIKIIVKNGNRIK
jgi:imidazolonepropionase-like amidohydrolase